MLRVSANIFAIVAAVLFTIALFGSLSWLGGNVNVEAFKDAGLVALALSGFVGFGPFRAAP